MERSGTPGTTRIYRASPRMRATAIDSSSMMTKWRITKSCRPLRGLDVYLRHIPGVPLTLHLKLYAAARIRGLRTRQYVSNDKITNLSYPPIQEYLTGALAPRTAIPIAPLSRIHG